jgi:hypothetical protein
MNLLIEAGDRNADEDLKYTLHWRSRFIPTGGALGPTNRESAARIATQWNLLTDIDYWIEPVDVDVDPRLARCESI